jgi:hypothetical protein
MSTLTLDENESKVKYYFFGTLKADPDKPSREQDAILNFARKSDKGKSRQSKLLQMPIH